MIFNEPPRSRVLRLFLVSGDESMKKLIASMLLGTAVAAVGCAEKKPAPKPATPAPPATTPADKPMETPPAK
jgi:hypothetical protein